MRARSRHCRQQASAAVRLATARRPADQRQSAAAASVANFVHENVDVLSWRDGLGDAGARGARAARGMAAPVGGRPEDRSVIRCQPGCGTFHKRIAGLDNNLLGDVVPPAL